MAKGVPPGSTVPATVIESVNVLSPMPPSSVTPPSPEKLALTCTVVVGRFWVYVG